MYPFGILRKLPHNLEISDIRNRMNTRLMVANIEVIIVLFGSILLFFLLSVCLKLSIFISFTKITIMSLNMSTLINFKLN